jgi:hypothetical protein
MIVLLSKMNILSLENMITIQNLSDFDAILSWPKRVLDYNTNSSTSLISILRQRSRIYCTVNQVQIEDIHLKQILFRVHLSSIFSHKISWRRVCIFSNKTKLYFYSSGFDRMYFNIQFKIHRIIFLITPSPWIWFSVLPLMLS